jgi:hypothetical protein
MGVGITYHDAGNYGKYVAQDPLWQDGVNQRFGPSMTIASSVPREALLDVLLSSVPVAVDPNVVFSAKEL